MVRSRLKRKLSRLPNMVPELICLLINISEAFTESALKLFIVQASCEQLNPDAVDCQAVKADKQAFRKVEEQASMYLMITRVLLELPVLLLLPQCGAWSDSVGGRLPLLVSAAGNVVSTAIYLASTLTSGGLLYLTLLGSLVRGLVCRTGLIVTVVTSVVASSSTHAQRTHRLSFLLATKYVGAIIGMFTEAQLLRSNRFSAVFFLDAVCFFVTFCVAFFFLEAAPVKRPSQQLHTNRRFHFCDVIRMLGSVSASAGRWRLWLVFGMIFLDRAVKSGEHDVTVLFVSSAIPSFSNADFSWLFMTETIVLAVLSSGVIYVIKTRLHVADLPLAMLAVVSRIARLCLLAVTDTVAMLYIGYLVGTPSTFFISISRSLLSQLIPDADYGKAFAVVACFESLGIVCGSLSSLGIYLASSMFFHGFVYVFNAGFYVIIFFILLYFWKDPPIDRVDMERTLMENTLVDRKLLLPAVLPTPVVI